MKYDVRVFVTLKDAYPDVKGKEVMGGLRSLGMAEGVINVRSGKVIDLKIDHDPTDTKLTIDQVVDAMCKQLLAHPVVEQHRYSLICYYEQPDGTTVMLPLSPALPPEEPFRSGAELNPRTWRIDLVGRWPAIGPYRLTSAEWWSEPAPSLICIKHSHKGVDQDMGWTLDIGAKRFWDSDEVKAIGKNRYKTLQALAPEICDYVVHMISTYGEEAFEHARA